MEFSHLNTQNTLRNQDLVIGRAIRVRGTVQGVGFRPTVWRLAKQLDIKGHVLNDGEGVLIEAWASELALSNFTAAIQEHAPPLSHINAIEQTDLRHSTIPETFEIARSASTDVLTNISPDANICADCIVDVRDPFNRRFRYPFTNCTNCGPRLSIVRAVPYDRSKTSMDSFPLCEQCKAEYENPLDRRFHAQPNACYACGPKAWLERMDGRVLSTEGLSQLDHVDAAVTLLQKGEIVAIKGTGGFHLAVDATNEESVSKLRTLKQRYHKPFALMARDLDVIRRYCHLNAPEESLLQSPPAPIVILSANGPEKVASAIAPRQCSLGFMLPYTALHHLLLMRMGKPIVLTSGNYSEEPQCIDNADAKERLRELSDYVLLHDRDIVNRLDDSVVRVVFGRTSILRRGRGYAPAPISLPKGFEPAGQLIAMGGELKNTFCMIKDAKAILSQHIGDLEDARTFADYQHNLKLYENLFAHRPEGIVVDLHPEYLSSKLGRQMSDQFALPLYEVQHHHAHIASVMAKNGWPLNGGKVLGVALDGLGFGENGSFWGGEFMRADYASFERLGTFKPVALLGGSKAMREPWRNTYAHIMAEMGWDRYKIAYDQLSLTRFFESQPLKTYNAMLEKGENVPLASSAGRLFDAVAAALGICRQTATYEGQAAIELENAVDMQSLEEEESLSYPFSVPRLAGTGTGTGLPYIEPLAMWHALFADLRGETPVAVIAARFHKGLARVIAYMIAKLSVADDQRWTNTIALTGGVFQNKILLELLLARLQNDGFQVLLHAKIPANDGGLSLGQAAIGAALTLKSQGA